MNIRNHLTYFLLFTFIIFSCEKEEKLVEDKRLQKEWELVSFYDNANNRVIEYPEEMGKIWILFTEDSVFMHSFCPTVGSEYQIQKDSTISIRGFIMQDMPCQLYDKKPYWDHDLASNLRKANLYQITGNELKIFSDGRYDLYFTERKH